MNGHGIRTESIRFEESVAFMHMAFDGKASTGSVVDAEARFAVGQFKWKPTAGDIRELCQAVNQRAGTPLMVPRAGT